MKFIVKKLYSFFKLRWFNANDMSDITLKKFLQIGTELSDKKFENIYEEISKHPEKAIFIFDGLDEFNGNFDCVDNLQPPNDPDISMPGISLFSKIISGRLLPLATVVVTSRPTANEFYSKITFDRTVEIIGFTEERIEEYVTKICQTHGREDYTSKILNHIQSSSDLLNSCYIPVNCFIVITILFERLEDLRNQTDALPTTLTELYEAAVTHFDKNHFRKLDALSYKKATEELQSLAYKAIETRQLIFDNKLFNEQMKQSGLLNCLSNPYSQAQTQFCFIHLTIQEFLAARHVTQTFSPEEIEEFILSHIKSGKWHLVLQFIAGLLGKEIKMFQKDRYKDCVLAFAKSFELTSGNDVWAVGRNYTSLLIMRCLREVQVEEIVKEACETTALNDIIGLNDLRLRSHQSTSSDWSAVFYFCKHMKNLKKLYLSGTNWSQESYQEALRMLQERCVEELLLGKPNCCNTGNVFKTLMESKCSLTHKQCSKLIALHIVNHDLTNKNLLSMSEFFRNGHGISLKKLHLSFSKISSHEFITSLCDVVNHKLCPELAWLDLAENDIGDGLTKLCHTLTKQKSKLTKLDIVCCSLTNECLPVVCELLRNECCNLIDLKLSNNKGINDEGIRILCERALTKDKCRLERLDLKESYLTVNCLPILCKTLQNEHCKLSYLSLCGNNITDEGVHILCELALLKEQCKLVELNLTNCLLTDECVPDLCKTLRDEHCRISELYLYHNTFTEKGEKSISEIETQEHCKARGLKIKI